MHYEFEVEEWGVVIRAFATNMLTSPPSKYEAARLSFYNRQTMSEFPPELCKIAMRVGPFRANPSDFDLARLFRFLGIERETDTAYPCDWWMANREMIDRMGGCFGYTYTDSIFGRPLYRRELFARIEAVIWSQLSRNDAVLDSVTFTD